jgi:aminopeptidase-like protein
MPLKLEKVPTGSKVFDWIAPQEWHCKRGRLWGPDKTLICDTEVNNLHLVNYSEPVKGEFSFEQLRPHLHSLPDLPDAIPYVTSYYRRTWGFCLSHNEFKNLKPGSYHVEIDSQFIDGGVPFASCVLEGKSDKEVLLTSYLCHPSLANNELSGPLVLLALYRRIKKWSKRRYSYRFLLNPETIGSLCFLREYQQHLEEKLFAGLILTCVGGPEESLRYKASRRGNTILDQLMQRHQSGKENCGLAVSYLDFDPRSGSDERQYCSPGFNLPVGQIARTVYENYDGYHNSLDTKEFMGIDSLVSSADAIENILKSLEISGCPVNQSPYGEPQLGKRNLYPNMNSESTRKNSSDSLIDSRTKLNRILSILNMSDGNTDTGQIADACECSIEELRETIETLEREHLIKYT